MKNANKHEYFSKAKLEIIAVNQDGGAAADCCGLWRITPDRRGYDTNNKAPGKTPNGAFHKRLMLL